MKIQVLKTELIANRYSVMSISSVQTYNLITTNVASGEVVKNIPFSNSKEVFDFYNSDAANFTERKTVSDLCNAIKNHGLC